MKKFKAGSLSVVMRNSDEQELKFHDGENFLHLEVFASGIDVDRKEASGLVRVHGWMFGLEPSQRKLAERLKKCIEAGKAFKGYEIRTDIYHETYISAEENGFFHKRHMNASLKKLGF